jgi:hypothetical protein
MVALSSLSKSRRFTALTFTGCSSSPRRCTRRCSASRAAACGRSSRRATC